MVDALILALTPWPILVLAVGPLLAGTRRSAHRDNHTHDADATRSSQEPAL